MCAGPETVRHYPNLFMTRFKVKKTLHCVCCGNRIKSCLSLFNTSAGASNRLVVRSDCRALLDFPRSLLRENGRLRRVHWRLRCWARGENSWIRWSLPFCPNNKTIPRGKFTSHGKIAAPTFLKNGNRSIVTSSPFGVEGSLSWREIAKTN